MSKMPTRTDWLLRFIAGTDSYDSWIDRIRIMKGMFLFQEETPGAARVNYKFVPFDYGPFTPEIYRDLEMLLNDGYIAASPDGKSFRATRQGREYLTDIEFPRDAEGALIEMRVEVCGLSFRDLLKRVYLAHPESAKRSVARDILG